jgi:hypothetical protein
MHFHFLFHRGERYSFAVRKFTYFLSSFSLTAKENEAKERPPSTWPSAALAHRLPAAVPQTRPDKSGLKQCGPFFRIQPLRSAALNGITRTTL